MTTNVTNNNGHTGVDNLLDFLAVPDEVIGVPPTSQVLNASPGAIVDNINLSSASTNNNTALFDLLGDLGGESNGKFH